jgi:hypothetical protein
MKFRDHGFDWIVWALFLGLPPLVMHQAATSLAEQGVASGGPLENAAVFPLSVAWVLAGLCVIHALRLIAGHVAKPSPVEGTPTTRLALVGAGAFVAFLLLLGTLGYYIAATLLLVALMRLLGVGWVISILATVAMTVGVGFIFEGLLNVVLPLGLWKITLFG